MSELHVVWSGRGSLPGAQDWPAQRETHYGDASEPSHRRAAWRPRSCACGARVFRNAQHCRRCWRVALEAAVADYAAGGGSLVDVACRHRLHHNSVATEVAARGITRPLAPTPTRCACGRAISPSRQRDRRMNCKRCHGKRVRMVA